MTQVAANGTVPEHFTGKSFHSKGTKNADAAGTRYDWDSNAGGLQ
jgi:hypothetical protein